MSLKETEKMHGMIHSVFSWTNVRLCEPGIDPQYVYVPATFFMYRKIVRCAETFSNELSSCGLADPSSAEPKFK